MPLSKRAAEKARQAASGGEGPPAGQDPQVPGQSATPAVADRGAMRKRLRRTRESRDVALHELGALVMEMYRQNRHDPALVERKAREAIAVDSEFRTLTGALESALPPRGAAQPPAGTPLAAPPPTGSPQAPPSGEPLAAPPTGEPLAAPPSGEPLAAPPPTGQPLAAPPAAGDRVSAAPPSPGDRVEPPSADGDGVPTYRVSTR